MNISLPPTINTPFNFISNNSSLFTAAILQNYFVNPAVDSSFSGLKAKKVKLITTLSLIGVERFCNRKFGVVLTHFGILIVIACILSKRYLTKSSVIDNRPPRTILPLLAPAISHQTLIDNSNLDLSNVLLNDSRRSQEASPIDEIKRNEDLADLSKSKIEPQTPPFPYYGEAYLKLSDLFFLSVSSDSNNLASIPETILYKYLPKELHQIVFDYLGSSSLSIFKLALLSETSKSFSLKTYKIGLSEGKLLKLINLYHSNSKKLNHIFKVLGQFSFSSSSQVSLYNQMSGDKKVSQLFLRKMMIHAQDFFIPPSFSKKSLNKLIKKRENSPHQIIGSPKELNLALIALGQLKKPINEICFVFQPRKETFRLFLNRENTKFLKRIVFNEIKFTRKMVNELINSKVYRNLEELIFNLNYKIRDKDAQRLFRNQKLEKLKELYFQTSKRPISNKTIKAIGTCSLPNLTSLTLSGVKITTGLMSLANNKTLQNLSDLKLKNCSLNDSIFESFIQNLRFPNLKTLDLGGNKLTALSLSVLSSNKGLSQLERVSLEDCKITEKEFTTFLQTPFAKRLLSIKIPDLVWEHDKEIRDRIHSVAKGSFNRLYAGLLEKVEDTDLYVTF